MLDFNSVPLVYSGILYYTGAFALQANDKLNFERRLNWLAKSPRPQMLDEYANRPNIEYFQNNRHRLIFFSVYFFLNIISASRDMHFSTVFFLYSRANNFRFSLFSPNHITSVCFVCYSCCRAAAGATNRFSSLKARCWYAERD